MTGSARVQLPSVGPPYPWSGTDRLSARARGLTFGLLSDRTGLARPGVFERAVEVLNLFQPTFVIQLGDVIEGYSSDVAEIRRQWEEGDDLLSRLETPLFRVPGNHDVSNDIMRDEWTRRHGALHYHFRVDDVLFLVLDTSDPPQDIADFGGSGDHELTPERLAELHAMRKADPEALTRRFEAMVDADATMPAALSDDQLEYFENVLDEHADADWTVVCMHIPAWQGEGNPSLERLRAALGARSYTMFGGHVHNYRRQVIDGRDHIRLGPSGGAWIRTGAEGNFDHVSLVRVGPHGLHVANVLLDGVLGVEGGARPAPFTSL